MTYLTQLRRLENGVAAQQPPQMMRFQLERTLNGYEVKIYSKTNGQLICVGDRCSQSSNQTAQRLAQNITDVSKFFQTIFGLNGVDGQGTLPPFFVDLDINNARWTCSGQACQFEFNNNFALIRKVVAHEFVHAIISNHKPLANSGDQRSINEHIADCLATACEHWITQNTQNWNIVDRDLSRHVTVQTKQQPNQATEAPLYYNSTILSHAFYHAVTETQTPTWGMIAQIWFRAMLQLNYNETFESFATKIANIAIETGNQAVVQAVKNAWQHVGFEWREAIPLQQPLPQPALTRNVQPLRNAVMRFPEGFNVRLLRMPA